MAILGGGTVSYERGTPVLGGKKREIAMHLPTIATFNDHLDKLCNIRILVCLVMHDSG